MIKYINKEQFEPTHLVLRSPGETSELLKKEGFKTSSLYSDKNGILKTARNLKKYLKNNTFDIIYAFGYRTNLYTRIIAPLTGHKTIITAQRSVDANRNKLISIIDKLTSKYVKLYISNSYAAAELLEKREKIKPEKIKVIHNGIDLEKYRVPETKEQLRQEYGYNKDDFIFINVGNLLPPKNHKLLINACSQVKKKNKIFKLLITGEGHLRRELENQIKELKLEDTVILLGKRTDIAKLLKLSDCFVFTSIWEGMPNAIMEAMASGLSIITTNVGDSKYLVKDKVNGFLLKNQDEKVLAEKMELLWKDTKLRKQFTEQSLKLIESFTNLRMIKEHQLLFKGIK